MAKTCFVIMPIGDQKYGDIEISSDELRKKYDYLIKEAIINANSEIEVIRADDVFAQGTITTDILTRLMHSNYVVADITYPNPNVFYELGIRHTCRSGTILIKNKNDPFGVPFDVSHSRYIEYEDSIEGLTTLSKNLARNFELLDQNPNYTDNHVLEFANFTKYKFLKFDDEEEIKKNKNDSFANVLVKLLGHPKLISVLTNKSLTEDQRNSQIIKELAKSPEDAIELIKYSIDSGDLKP